MNLEATAASAAAADEPVARKLKQGQRSGSLNRRMIVVAALWISALLLIGGVALDRVLTRSIEDQFNNQLQFLLNSMIYASEIDPTGEVVMAYVEVSSIPRRFGVTRRRDAWWTTPLLVFCGLSAFVVYSTWAAFQGVHYRFGPYLSPFYSPEVLGNRAYSWFDRFRR